MADTVARLDGELTMETVSGQLASLGGALPEQIDLSDIERVDSAGLSLLLELQARAAASGRTIDFRFPPTSLKVLARLSQVEELLGWDHSDQPS